MATTLSGEDWSKRFRDGYIEPINGVGMLTPYPLTPEWSTTYSGNYSRYKLANYAGIDTVKWIPVKNNSEDDGFIKWIGTTDAPTVTTQVSQPRNGAMWLGWYGANSDAQDFVQMECGYGGGDHSTDPLSFRFYASGKCEVWRNGTLEATYDYTGSGADADGFPSATAHQYVYVLIMPYRTREVLVISNRGGGFSHVYEDIEPDATDAEITPAHPFWWRVPKGLAQAACAQCKFKTSGALYGIKTFWPKPPASGLPLSNHVYGETHGGSGLVALCEADDPNTNWNPDGSSTVCRVKIALNGNGVRTPNIYGATAWFETRTAQTVAANRILDEYVVKASIEVSDSPSDVRVNFEIREPELVSNTIAPRILSVSNRAFALKLGSVSVLTGATEPAKYNEALLDMGRRLSIDVRDKWKALEHYLFSDPTPLDGVNLIEAIRFILRTAGIPIEQMDLEDIDFDLPTAEGITKGDFACQIEAGDSAADWLNRLHENYCANWFMGFVPTPAGTKFRLWSPEKLGSTSVFTLYDNTDDAYLAGATLLDRHAYTYRDYNDTQLEPEANSVWVMGRDPRTGKPILAFREDAVSQDPTIDPADAPDNWLGEPRKYGLIDSSISSYEALGRAVDILYKRLTPTRYIAEFTTEFMVRENGVPVWRGDVITLDGHGDYRIKSFSTEVKKDYDNGSGWYWRPTKYVAELIGDPSAGLSHHGGFSLPQLIAMYEAKAISKTTVRKDLKSQGLKGLKVLKAVGV